jgi:hypothetical protein
MSAILHGDYRIEGVYQNLSDNLRNEVILFWLDNQALSDIAQARQRVDEVAFVVRSPANDLVGISTVFAAPYGANGDVYLHYRMFIHPAHRVPGLMRAITRATRCYFETNPDARGAARGMIICTENPKLMRSGVKRLFERSVWGYAGKDPRGFDVWKFTFPS